MLDNSAVKHCAVKIVSSSSDIRAEIQFDSFKIAGPVSLSCHVTVAMLGCVIAVCALKEHLSSIPCPWKATRARSRDDVDVGYNQRPQTVKIFAAATRKARLPSLLSIV